MLKAESQEDTVVPPRREAIQALVAVGHIARRLFAPGQAARVLPLGREGVKDLGGEHARYHHLQSLLFFIFQSAKLATQNNIHISTFWIENTFHHI